MSEHPQGYCPVFGNYPKEYNRAVHGPYHPFVNYGPKDTPFYEVKLGELSQWMSRRSKTPQAFAAGFSRLTYRWIYYWKEPRYASPSKPILQVLYFSAFLSMLSMQKLLRTERNHKYHW